MEPEFDLSDIDATRIEEIDRGIAEREASACETPEYPWEKLAKVRANLETQIEYWQRRALAAENALIGRGNR